MNFPRLIFCSALLTTSDLWAVEPYQPPTQAPAEVQLLAPDAVKRALEMLCSGNASVRDKAATALRQRSLTDATKKQAVELFKQAQQHHLKLLEAQVKRGATALIQVKTTHDAWATKRGEVMKLILTDYKKDPQEIAMLTREHEATEKLLNAFDKELSKSTPAWKPLVDATAPLERLDHAISLTEGPSSLYQAKSAEAYLKELGAAKAVLETWQIANARQRSNQELVSVTAHNESCKWAAKSAIAFATLLNQKRGVMNLAPLRLDENLSNAATSHSKEMAAMGYFAHESPVPANKGPGDRARNANFEGGWSGENIFMGSAGSNDAYWAWWGSDGHRFIMFADGPNTLGAGPAGVHWTMMTGKKNWPQ
jgi:uncharacterized protein YkwD